MAGRSVFSKDNYIEYQAGSLNVIVSIPHGGFLLPATIPNRDAGSWVNDQWCFDHKYKDKDFENCAVRYKRDSYTIEIGQQLADELQKLTNHRPHVIINRLSRCKMDANSDLEKASFNVPEAVAAWRAYHEFIQRAKNTIDGPGLFLDIHGQRHEENWVELGYTLTAEMLNCGNYTSSDTSISHFATNSELYSIQDVIYGAVSLGGILSSHSYKTVPSPAFPSPTGCKYYTGGYNTERHGSKSGGHFDAIQVECPKTVRNEVNGPTFSKALAKSVNKFLLIHYKKELHEIGISTSQ